MSIPVMDVGAAPRARRRLAMLRNGELSTGWVAIILIGHGIYGLLLARSAALATVHALVTFAIGIWFAMTSTMRRVALVCGYMAGSEVLWRLGHAMIPWEFVKYAICTLAILTMSRVPKLRWDWPAATYFALLLPSAFISFSEGELEFTRQQVSFNLSGPLVLATMSWYCSRMRLSRGEVQRLFVVIMAPVMSLAFIALTKAASIENLTFTSASNFQTSAGYGPNQVSSVLGFGVLLALLCALLVERDLRTRILFALVALLLGVQSALTFSRGGLFGAIGALVIATPYLARGTRTRMVTLAGAVVLVGAVQFVILPRLDAMTGGALVTRFKDTNPTGRDELIRTELETFAQHPIFGTGPGALDEYGELLSSTHTEFTRLLAQHGVFGALALAAMMLIGWRSIMGQKSSESRAIALALIAWSLLTMSHAAMRLAVTPFAFGLAATGLLARARSARLAPSDQPANEASVPERQGAGVISL